MKNSKVLEKLYLNSPSIDFDLHTQNEPHKLIVDPDYKILKIQRMPPRLEWIWDVYPEMIVIYGTLSEGEANHHLWHAGRDRVHSGERGSDALAPSPRIRARPLVSRRQEFTHDPLEVLP